MYVLVDLDATPPAVTLEEPDDCTRFYVAAMGARDPAVLASALDGVVIGWLAGDDAFIRTEAVRAMAGGRVGEGWADGFDRMLDYARGKGWLDDAGDAIQAHVEWDAPA